MPKPGGFKSVAGTFSGSDAALSEVDAAVPPSAYNANYLKSASKRRYPAIHGPITNKQAFAILQDAPEEQTKMGAAAESSAPVQQPYGSARDSEVTVERRHQR